MTDARLAILGMGRSGVAAAKAALHAGAKPFVLDQGKGSSTCRAELEALGVPATSEWAGAITPENADLLVISPGVPLDNQLVKAAREAGVLVIGEVELAYRVAKAPIVALTGTNGKSTTTVMTYLCLKAAGQKPILCGNIYGSGYEEMPLTEAAVLAGPDQVLVAEISSFQLESIETFRPVCAGITNIWADHLTRYDGSEKIYAATKQRIFRNQGAGDYAVVRALDPVVKQPHGPTVLTFGSCGDHALVEPERLTVLGTKIDVASLPFREPHNFQNGAMALLLAYGFLEWRRAQDPASLAAQLLNDAEAQAAAADKRSVYSRRPNEPKKRALPAVLVEGLRTFQGLAHRMQPVGTRDGVSFINNSMCTNVDAVVKSATAVAGPKHLLMGGVNKGLDFRPLRNFLANRRDCAYLYGRDALELSNMLGGEWPVFETLEQAFRAAVEAARPGETIMLSPGCASQDQFEDFRARGDVFTKLAKEWLEK